jgi:hypothetical protein
MRAGKSVGVVFPPGKLVGLFCLHTGRLLAFVESARKDHDLSLARRLLRCLHAGEVLVADRAYCGWLFLVQLLARKVDFVIRLHQARAVRSRRQRSWRETWKKPPRPRGQSKRSWKKTAGGTRGAAGALSSASPWIPHPKRHRRHFAARRKGFSRLGHRRALRPPLAGRHVLRGRSP